MSINILSSSIFLYIKLDNFLWTKIPQHMLLFIFPLTYGHDYIVVVIKHWDTVPTSAANLPGL